MKYLIFTNTPAHVHLYRNAVRELQPMGHEVLILARDYGCTVDLLEWYDLPFEVYGRCETSKVSLFGRLPGHYARIARTALSFGPDLILGMGSYAAHAGLLTRTRTILLLDSEPTTLDHRLSVPFADTLLTPASFRKDLGSNHCVFDGFKETAYLHPAEFSGRSDIRDHLGVGTDRYVLVRFNAFGSHHDVGHGGFTTAQRRALVERLAEYATVFVSDEGGDLSFVDLPARPFDLHPARLHDALAEASLLIADTQTMVTEAALLGTPAIRSNSFVGGEDMGNFLELEQRGLIVNHREYDDVVATAIDLLNTDDIAETWARRRDDYLADKVNLTDLLVEIATTTDDIERIDRLSRWTNPDPTHEADPSAHTSPLD